MILELGFGEAILHQHQLQHFTPTELGSDQIKGLCKLILIEAHLQFLRLLPYQLPLDQILQGIDTVFRFQLLQELLPGNGHAIHLGHDFLAVGQGRQGCTKDRQGENHNQKQCINPFQEGHPFI